MCNSKITFSDFVFHDVSMLKWWCVYSILFLQSFLSLFCLEIHTVYLYSVFLSAAEERDYNSKISKVKANYFMSKIWVNIFSVTLVPLLSLISSDDNSCILSWPFTNMTYLISCFMWPHRYCTKACLKQVHRCKIFPGIIF